MTLDPDVERMLRVAVRERGVSFKDALNEAIRAGLSAAVRPRARRYSQRTFSLGSEQLFRWEKALTVAEGLEDEEHSRKIALRK